MGFFNWAAPAFGHFADRWSPESIDEISGWLEPYLGGERRVLDVGGGTGALASRLSESTGARVTVLDPTPEMLRYIPDDGPIEGVVGTAEAMPFPDDSFDAVIVTDAFHHFRDQPGAVSEFCRVVRTGGGVLVVELDPAGVVMRLIVLGEKLLGEPGAFFTPDAMCEFMRVHGIAGNCAVIRGVSYRFVGTVR
ncbi:MAG: methyltransferase domain-containing protein [Actinobacteria bacterium]|nr:methyltransferase domain-containing protein [Actinomycetota bacterium]MCG2807234.1 methyltransferase domain-containing protein [Coriobacteriia bacterium]